MPWGVPAAKGCQRNALRVDVADGAIGRQLLTKGRRVTVYPGDLHYNDSHQWARVEDGVATVGITHYAQDQLGEVVYVELPDRDDEARRGEPLGTVESVKAVADVNSPVSGRVIEVNSSLDDHPEQINEDPYGTGWLARIDLSDPAEVRSLMSAQEYVKHVQQLGEQGSDA